MRLPYHWSQDNQGQETFLAPSADKKTHNHKMQSSNHHLSLSALRPKGLSRRKIKCRVIYTNLPVNVIVRLSHPRSGESQCQKRFLAPSANKQTHNHDIEWSNHHSSLSSLRPKGLCRSKIQLWAIYTNLPVNIMVRLPNPRSGYRQSQETFLAPTAEKQTRDHHIEFTNHHPSTSTL